MNLGPPPQTPWQTAPAPSWTSQQKKWLMRPGALTAGLRELGHVDLRVAREQPCGLSSSEAWMLRRETGSPVWLREIVMAIDGSDGVFARSFTPLNASHGLWRGMRFLRTRPLADMLYKDPEITRSRFFVCRMNARQPLYQTARRIFGPHCPAPQDLLARFSIFSRGPEPLVVAECFLPAFWDMAIESPMRPLSTIRYPHHTKSRVGIPPNRGMKE